MSCIASSLMYVLSSTSSSIRGWRWGAEQAGCGSAAAAAAAAATWRQQHCASGAAGARACARGCWQALSSGCSSGPGAGRRGCGAAATAAAAEHDGGAARSARRPLRTAPCWPLPQRRAPPPRSPRPAAHQVVALLLNDLHRAALGAAHRGRLGRHRNSRDDGSAAPAAGRGTHPGTARAQHRGGRHGEGPATLVTSAGAEPDVLGPPGRKHAAQHKPGIKHNAPGASGGGGKGHAQRAGKPQRPRCPPLRRARCLALAGRAAADRAARRPCALAQAMTKRLLAPSPQRRGAAGRAVRPAALGLAAVGWCKPSSSLHSAYRIGVFTFQACTWLNPLTRPACAY